MKNRKLPFFLWDSITKKKRILNISQKNIRGYLCGPTLYAEVHIGNLRPVLTFDVINRTVRAFGYSNLILLHNITDIDKKISDWDLTEGEEIIKLNILINRYSNLLKRLNLSFSPMIIRVSEFIPDIVKFIEKIYEQRYAFVDHFSHDVHFLEEKRKKSFVIWRKIINEKERKFQSPWGEGQPGWHTECAALIDNFFNSQTIDIHGGGRELKFPHHYNENLQYKAVNNRPIARIWLHNELLHFQKKKVAKSQGYWQELNARKFVRLYGVNTLKYILFSFHYRQPLFLSTQLITVASAVVRRWSISLKRAKYKSFLLKSKENLESKLSFSKSRFSLRLKKKALDYLSHDLKTNQVIDLINLSFKNLNKRFFVAKKSTQIDDLVREIRELFRLTGFHFRMPYYTRRVVLLILQWEKEKKERNFVVADKIRSQLNEVGVLE